MKIPNCWLSAALLAARLPNLGVNAAEFKRLDGLHRVEKRAEITAAPVLHRRQDNEGDGVCETNYKACPASLNGGCCPVDYDCASESCYATSSGVSTCQGRTSYYACDAVYGAGCCPQGYLCQRGNNCVPPQGSSFTFDCPSGRFLCPESMNYGCCPNGMECGKNICYTTEPATFTSAVIITTTDDDTTSTYTSMVTRTSTPDIPTEFPTVDADTGPEDQQVFKFYPPSSVTKMPQSSAEPDDDGGDGGLTTAQLAGIVTGAVVFLIIFLVIAYIIVRHLNKVVAYTNNTSQKSGSAQTRPTMKHFETTDSEIDGQSVSPLVIMGARHHRPRRLRMGSDTLTDNSMDISSSGRPTPSSFAGGYQAVSTGSPRQGSFDMAGNLMGMFPPTNSAQPMTQATTAPSLGRPSTESQATYAHGRQLSNASEASSDNEGMSARIHTPLMELEGTPYVPELVGSPSDAIVSPLESYQRTETTSMPRPPQAHQRMRSESRGVGGTSGLDAVAEEPSRFHSASSQAQRFASRESGSDSLESPIVYTHPSQKRRG